MRPLLAYSATALLVVATLAIAGAGTRPQTVWYRELIKPAWQPDPSLIGLAWTVLYPVIAIVGGFILTRTEGRERLIWWAALLVNLGLNALWSWVFFTWQAPWGATVEIATLLASTVLLIVLAWPVSTGAALALVPYAAWVSFAGFLTFTLARLN